MNSDYPKYTILLAMKSPILAPLYLAKVRGGAFRNIEFKYAFELPHQRSREGGGDTYDPLAELVLSKAEEDSRYIAGVADPFRSMINTDGAKYAAQVVAGLIRHQTFWLATDDEELKNFTGRNAAMKCHYIVSQPMYTSGFAVLQKFLELGKVTPDQNVNADKIGLVPEDRGSAKGLSQLYYDTLPGFERQYYRHLLRHACKYDRYAYLTTNPADHHGPLVQFARSGSKDTSEFRNTLMTALFCGNGWSVRHPTLFDDIRHDIMRAMQAIHNDPIRAAVELKNYSAVSGDRFMSFSNETLPHKSLVQILEDLSIRDEIYSNDLLIEKEHIRKGGKFRLDSPSNNPWKKSFEESADEAAFQKFVEDYFVREIVVETPAAQEQETPRSSIDRERTANLPEFVRSSFQNYREFVECRHELDRHDERHHLKIKEFSQWALSCNKYVFIFVSLLLSGLALVRAFGGLQDQLPYWSVSFAIASLCVAAPAFTVRETRQVRESLIYDFVLLLVALTDAGIITVKSLWHYFPNMSDGDKLAVVLFCISTAILFLGAIGVALRKKIALAWENVVLKWAEESILLFKVGRSKTVPPVECIKTGKCTMRLKCRILSLVN